MLFLWDCKISRQNYYFNKDNSLYEVPLINSSKKFTLFKMPYFSHFKKQFSPGSLLPQLMQKIYKVKTASFNWVSFVAQLVKNSPAMRETWVWSLGWEDPLEKEKATHSSILAWRIPWTIQSMGSQKARHNWATFTHTEPKLFIIFISFSFIRFYVLFFNWNIVGIQY